MNINLQDIKKRIFPQKNIGENYFFMLFSQSSNLIIGLLLLPYLLRTLGKEAYGTYIFINSNVQLLNMVIIFGFGLPALKKFSENRYDNKVKSQVLSEVFSARIYLFLLCGCILIPLLYLIPFMRQHDILYLLIFSTTISTALFPNSYFQGMQKLKISTSIILISRLLSLLLIFLFVKSESDLFLYVLIISSTSLAAALCGFFHILFIHRISVYLLPLGRLKNVFLEAMPFFWSSVFGKIKQEVTTLILGLTFDMASLALWDLAQKVVSIPRLMTNNINDAIFPSVIQGLRPEMIKKVIRIEQIIGISIILTVFLLGYPAVSLLGGESMTGAYPLVCLLSTSIYASLIVGCYFYFIFVPKEKYNFVPRNQLVSLVSFFLILTIGLLFVANITIVALAFSTSCFIEVLYCRYVIRKHKLLVA